MQIRVGLELAECALEIFGKKDFFKGITRLLRNCCRFFLLVIIISISVSIVIVILVIIFITVILDVLCILWCQGVNRDVFEAFRSHRSLLG